MKVTGSSFALFTPVVFSSPGIVPYSLLGYIDVRNNTPVDGLSYVNTPLTSCEVALINLVQSESDGSQNMVGTSADEIIKIYRHGFRAILRLNSRCCWGYLPVVKAS